MHALTRKQKAAVQDEPDEEAPRAGAPQERRGHPQSPEQFGPADEGAGMLRASWPYFGVGSGESYAAIHTPLSRGTLHVLFKEACVPAPRPFLLALLKGRGADDCALRLQIARATNKPGTWWPFWLGFRFYIRVRVREPHFPSQGCCGGGLLVASTDALVSRKPSVSLPWERKSCTQEYMS